MYDEFRSEVAGEAHKLFMGVRGKKSWVQSKEIKQMQTDAKRPEVEWSVCILGGFEEMML